MSFRRIRRIRSFFAAGACAAALIAPALSAPAGAAAAPGPAWVLHDTGSATHFRALAAVSAKVAWVGGYHGIVRRTTDGGRTWVDVSPAGAQKLQFRDISAFDARHAVAMAAGPVGRSRLYVTADGGTTWRLTYRNRNAEAFFDCMSFYDSRHGLVLSDPVDGKFAILSTTDGGQHWTVLPSTGMPATLAGEYGFAASGECLTTAGHDAWFGSGGAAARVWHSTDGGRTWTVTATPLAASPSSGVFGLAFANARHGIAVGGDYAHPTVTAGTGAYTAHGSPWTAATGLGGYRSGVSFVPGTADAVAVGLTGSDLSTDGGRHWTTFDTGQFDTVSCTHGGACWASGDLGRVATLRR